MAQLEEGCRGKEADRVNLELKLTEVKENLKKSLAGGVLGAAGDLKQAPKVLSLRSRRKHGREHLGQKI